MKAIFKREVKAYFYSPIAYIFMTAFFIISGIYFYLGNIFPQGMAHFNYTLDALKVVLLFIIPILTMRLFAEERSNKTDQLLITSPLSVISIVLGKYFAALMVFITTLLVSLVYPFILSRFAQIPIAEIINAYVGFLLLGGVFIAIGMFTSTLTENQLIAAVIGFLVLLVLWMLEWIGVTVSNIRIYQFIEWLSIIKRYRDFSGGILRFETIIYYLSYIFLFIFLAVRGIEKRRWSQG